MPVQSYRLLPSSSDGVDEHIFDSDDKHPPLATARPVYLRFCVLICFLCTLVNIALTFKSNTTPSPSLLSSSLTREDIQHLRRPSQFIGLENVRRPSPPVAKQFDNYPILLSQVDQAEESKVFDNEQRRYMSHAGTISPEYGRVLVNRTISTIIQFRAIDFGMETCELRVLLPSSITKSPILPGQGEKGEIGETLSLHRLNASTPLNVRTLSYRTRPPPVSKVADIRLSPENNTSWHRKFSCASEQVLTFELACSSISQGDDCNLQWWQNKEDPNPAFDNMTQAEIGGALWMWRICVDMANLDTAVIFHNNFVGPKRETS
ncbi:hypothetical protein EW146_g149 [Bondarzewia mesenterica]|uniref:Ubiquitin 3 binding protein But2 C-terminal domain-containing protein n=1 Tax=Bondarzewia mesenterica TaxID=1095465 RepID=A0A4S4MA42_9AGAM|nr:hypothetical protein EW146_g149 [Bondarzewia mesenterica]